MSPTTESEALKVEAGERLTYNVQPLLHEIRHGLGQLLANKATTTIDLRSIPLAPGEEDEIIATLGVGEIRAQLSALGPSEITETRFPGVWLVTHYNNNEEIIGRFIEVCDIPRLLRAQAEDIRDGLDRLEEQLGTSE